MGTFDLLTKYLSLLDGDQFGEWNPIHKDRVEKVDTFIMPYVNYSETIKDFIRDVYRFADSHIDFDLNQYNRILQDHCIDLTSNWQTIDISSLDAQCLTALIMGAIRTERFCDGTILGLLEGGYLQAWLGQLQKFEQQ